MPLSDEIKQAAEILGQSLGTNPAVEAYLELKARAASDPETAALEARLAVLLPYASGDGQESDPLSETAPSEYFALRKKIRYHPILSARESQLALVKGIFAQTGSEISAILGQDYTTLAAGQPKES